MTYEDTTGRFLFSLFDSSVMSEIVERVFTVKLFRKVNLLTGAHQ